MRLMNISKAQNARQKNTLKPMLIVTLFLAAIAGITWMFGHFNVFTGEYAYDPRRAIPSEIVFQNTPESVLRKVLGDQIQHDGTYPPGAARLRRYEPIYTQVGLYTDWHGFAYVTMMLEYESGEQVREQFRLMAIRDTHLVPFADVIGHLEFGQIALCSPTSEPHVSYCALQAEISSSVLP